MSPAEHSIREDRDQLKLIKNIYENQVNYSQTSIIRTRWDHTK